MELAIVRGGGLAGFATTTRLRPDALSPQNAQELESMVRNAGLLAEPEPAPDQGPSHPDDLLYEVTVDDGDQQRTLRFSDETMPDGVRRLIEWVDSQPERELERGA